MNDIPNLWHAGTTSSSAARWKGLRDFCTLANGRPPLLVTFVITQPRGVMVDGSNRNGSGPILDGVRILDMSTAIAGPVATMLLAEVGADVVKVEPPEPGPDREEPGFRTWNRSKRSAALNLSTADGRARLELLLAA